jgi:hypothetical protein
MKPIFVLVLVFLSSALPIPTRAQIYRGADSAQRAQHAAKKDQKSSEEPAESRKEILEGPTQGSKEAETSHLNLEMNRPMNL